MKKKSILSSWQDMVVFIAMFVFIAPSNQLKALQHPSSNETNFGLGDRFEGRDSMTVPYFRTTIPMRIYECLRNFNTLRCTKLYVLQKMEERKSWINTGNLTKDFLNQFFDNNDQMGSLISERFRKMPDNELNKKLVFNFQKFFKNRDIKMRFLPGMLLKIVPNKDNKLKFSLKKKSKPHLEGRSQDTSGLVSVLKENGLVDGSLETHEIGILDDDDIGGKSKHKISKKKPKRDKTSYKTTILQMAVPVMMMPAILLGTFLPFILPVLKMATLTTMIMNNTAFMAALIYAARQHVNSQDEQHINYSYGGHPGGYH